MFVLVHVFVCFSERLFHSLFCFWIVPCRVEFLIPITKLSVSTNPPHSLYTYTTHSPNFLWLLSFVLLSLTFFNQIPLIKSLKGLLLSNHQADMLLLYVLRKKGMMWSYRKVRLLLKISILLMVKVDKKFLSAQR